MEVVKEKVTAKGRITGAVLRDGQSLRIRHISPDDKKRLEELFYRLSPRTRYLRFQYAKERITPEELAYFTEVTPPERAAFVATTGTGEGERIIAVARWDRTDRNSAEVAFTVEDDIQLRGIGTVLLEVLAGEALKHDIRVFMATVLKENTRMLEVFEESGFRYEKRSSEDVFEFVIDLKDQEEFEERQAYREHIARSAGVRRLLKPRRVAVVGASRDPESVGGALFRNVLKHGFTGAVFPVNPKADSIAGVMAYPTVKEVPGDIDLAVVVVPAERVLDVVDVCAEKCVPALVIISAGFSEAGGEGAERERKLKEKLFSYGMRLVGPNCLGVLDNTPEVKLNATFSPITPPSGNLSLGSQSGALGIALLDYAESKNLGVAQFISFGNSTDVTANDMLEFWEDDPDTSVVALYIESFGNPRKFSRTARRVSSKKPIIAVKAGRSLVGAKAATSHTGAMAATDVAVDALFRQAGVIRVNTIEEMFNAAEILSTQPSPAGNRVGILSNAGGPAVLAADACEGFDLEVTELSDKTRQKLGEFLPPEAATANPVDMIASATPETYRKALEVMLDSPEVDSVIIIYIPPLVTKPAQVARAIGDVLARRKDNPKPVLTCFMMPEREMEKIRTQSAYALRPFIFPEDAVRSLAIARDYSRYRELPRGRVTRFSDVDYDRVREEFLEKVTPTEEGFWLMPETAMWLLGSYRIPVADTLVAADPNAASDAARSVGFPAVMKVRSSTIVHKSDIGGIRKGIGGPEEARDAFLGIKWAVENAVKGAGMDGVVVQPMAGEGVEMIIGMTQDPVFGPLVVTGFGGVMVELMKDVAFSIHPLRDVDPERMLGKLKSLPLLEGWRGEPPADIEALKETLLRFSLLIEDFPELDQVEINPLMVKKQGSGCVAVDARVFVKKPSRE